MFVVTKAKNNSNPIAVAEMLVRRSRQKCVMNASKWVLFYWEKRNVLR